jgi:phospholipase C
VGDAIPIDHFVIIMQENRSFDHYFQALPESGQPDVEVAPSDFSNPKSDDSDERVPIHHAKAYCQHDVEHGWSGVHQQWAGGSMQGFVKVSHGDPEAMAYYTEADLPYYYALARTFAIADHHFSDVMGPTFPNRMFALMGSSHGLATNQAAPKPARKLTIFHRLAAAGISFTIYSDQDLLEELILPELRSELREHFAPMARFASDAEAGALPAFSWIESSIRSAFDGEDEHPPSNMQLGQRFVARTLNTLMRSSAWPRSAAFLTYDEHGGFYDHVPPPDACRPDDEEPNLAEGAVRAQFDHYGMRVPLIAVSPYAKPHHVTHDVLSHSSLLRLVEARFNLPAVSARAANAQVPLDMFDFSEPHFASPPDLPEAVVDEAELKRCQKAYPAETPPAAG